MPRAGQQVTLGSDGPDATLLSHEGGSVGDRIRLLRERALVETPRAECDLYVKGIVGSKPRGWVMQPNGHYLDDRGERVAHEDLVQLARVPGQELTFTCAYPGGGRRMGVDRDADGILDGLEGAPRGAVAEQANVSSPR